MPPRIAFPTRHLRRSAIVSPRVTNNYLNASYASLASATTPASPTEILPQSPAPQILRYPPTQPPSHKPPDSRKSQLLRQYISLLRSSPLLLIIQHNNLLASEWVAVRRELATSLARADPSGALDPTLIRLQVIRGRLFELALRITEFYDPPPPTSRDPSDPFAPPPDDDALFTHALSRAAHAAANEAKFGAKRRHGFEPVLTGPLAVLAFPSVSPAHVTAALGTLFPGPGFPAPKRRVRPTLFEPAVQAALPKMMLLAARVEGRVLDQEGARWVGGIEGGMDGLRARLVAMLQGFGAGLTGALEGAGKNLYFTMESRRTDMEDKEVKGKDDVAGGS